MLQLFFQGIPVVFDESFIDDGRPEFRLAALYSNSPLTTPKRLRTVATHPHRTGDPICIPPTNRR